MCSTNLVDARSGSAAVDLDQLSDGELLDHVKRLVAEQNRVAGQLAAAVRKAECRQAAEHDGLKSVKSWLRTHTRLSGRAIGQLVGNGRALEFLPAVEAAFAAGRVTGDQVDVIADIARPEHRDRAAAQDVDLAVIERSEIGRASCRERV